MRDACAFFSFLFLPGTRLAAYGGCLMAAGERMGSFASVGMHDAVIVLAAAARDAHSRSHAFCVRALGNPASWCVDVP